ncbi:MAG: hypothetical protein L6R41_003430 [Letrouitia leprolyta]|nr:MAG: hypothetical protein L6R41_003430 [Letrouitia leprolyta]
MEDTRRQQSYVPARTLDTEFPLIDSDPHFKRVCRYARPSDYGVGAVTAAAGPCVRFYGFTENQRERDMDMREMVDKVKKNEPLYGKSSLSPHMQGVASRNSRYAGVWLHVIPWFNFVNHEQHGVDTVKYYQQAERELEAERTKLT